MVYRSYTRMFAPSIPRHNKILSAINYSRGAADRASLFAPGWNPGLQMFTPLWGLRPLTISTYLKVTPSPTKLHATRNPTTGSWVSEPIATLSKVLKNIIRMTNPKGLKLNSHACLSGLMGIKRERAQRIKIEDKTSSNAKSSNRNSDQRTDSHSIQSLKEYYPDDKPQRGLSLIAPDVNPG